MLRWTVLILLVAVCSSGTSLAETSLTMFSELGDPIGDGRQYAFSDADGPFTVTRNARNGVSILFWATHGDNVWNLDFAGGSSQPLTVQTYFGVARYPSTDPTRPGMNVTGNHLACATITGSFEVLDVAYNAAGGIDRFRARFEQFCQGAVHALAGEIRFNATVPVHLTVPRAISVVIGHELRFGITGVADDNGAVALSASGLPADAVLAMTGPNSSEFLWTPGPTQVGSYTVTFFAEDGAGHVENSVTRITVGGILRVPSDQPTIQAAVDAAAPASIVNVGPGTYIENIDLRGKALTLRSESGPETTIIDGNRRGPVFRCKSFEGRETSIMGFTIQGGGASDGAGISMSRAAPTVVGNVFQANTQYSGGWGAAIGGIRSSPVIDGNIFRNNSCDAQSLSGVISFLDSSSPQVTNNLLENNPCRAIMFFVDGSMTPSVINNTIVGNTVGIKLDGRVTRASHVFSNNVIVGNSIGLQVELASAATNPTWTHNLLFQNAVNYQGFTDLTGTNGNISAAPAFLCPAKGDYRLSRPSAAVDSGDNAAPGLPGVDLKGTARIIDGDSDGTAVVDMGAFEFNPSSPGICLLCPTDITVYAPVGHDTATVVYPPPTVSDGSGVACAPLSGSMFPEGTTLVTCTAHDSTGDSESCSFRVTVLVPPANDDFDDATGISTLPFVDAIDTRNARVASDDPTCFGQRASVWYAYTPDRDMFLKAQTYGSSYVATVSAYTGSRGNLTQLACTLQYLAITVRAGQTVYFMVTPYSGTGDLVFTLKGRPALKIALDGIPSGTVAP